MPVRRRGTRAGNPNRPSQRARREAGLSAQDLRDPVEPDHPPPEVEAERSRSARTGTHTSQRVSLRPRETESSVPVPVRRVTESSVAVPIARSVAVPLPPGQSTDQGFWVFVAPASSGGEVPAAEPAPLLPSSSKASAPVASAEVATEASSEVPEPAEPPKGTARARAKRDLSPLRRRPTTLIKGKPQTKEQGLAQALANEEAGGQAVVDCRLEYRALLEAYSPGKPPLEIAQQFLDKLAALQKAWYRLKKGREELEKALKEEAAAPRQATEEEQIIAAADKAVSFAESTTLKKAKTAAPSKVTISPALPKKAKSSLRPASASPSSKAKARGVIDVEAEGSGVAGSTPKAVVPKAAASEASAPRAAARLPREERSLSPPPVRRPQAVAAEGPAYRGWRYPRGSPEDILASRKPLIVLDWHQTLSLDRPDGSSFVPAENKSLLQKLQGKGFVLGILSFASKQETQEKVLAGVQALERQLPNPFVFVAVTNRKFEDDREPRYPSSTGHSDSKARILLNLGAAAFVDDQGRLLQEARGLQRNRPSQLRLATIQAKPWKRGEILEDLESWSEDHSASNLPSIETYRQYLDL